MSIDAMRIIAVQPKHLYCAGALYWKSPRRFLSGENVREGLEQVSRVMANNQSQQWGRKKFNKVVQAWRRLKGPKKSKWGSNIWVIASSPICLNKGANWRSIVFSHYFVISCTFYVNTGHLRCLETFSFDSFRSVHQNSITGWIYNKSVPRIMKVSSLINQWLWWTH